MQTIDSIRRTNELSKVLRQHGFAQDSFDAVSQAQDTLSQQPLNTSTVYDASSQSHSHKNHSSENERFEAKIATLERSKHLLSSRVDSLQKELQSTQEYVRQLVARLEKTEAKLRSQGQQVQQPQQVMPVARAQEQMVSSAPTQQTQAPVQQEQQTSSRGTKTIDPSISIENIFNCSGK